MTIPESQEVRNNTSQNDAGQRTASFLGLPGFWLPLLVLMLSVSGAFGAGVLVERGAVQRGDISIINQPMSPGLPAVSSTTHEMPSGGEVVGSKTSKRYYLPWCPAATTIAKSEQIWFADESSAQSDGYVAGGKCPGI